MTAACHRPAPRVTFDENPDWIDDVIVEQAIHRRPTPRELTAAEKAAAARELTRRGHSINDISRQLHVHGNVVRAATQGPA